jgi:hypothetical protein
VKLNGRCSCFCFGAYAGEIIIADERYDLRLYLANRGVETWTLDYCTHTVARDELRDSRFMETWTVETFVEDAAATNFVRTSGGVR